MKSCYSAARLTLLLGVAALLATFGSMPRLLDCAPDLAALDAAYDADQPLPALLRTAPWDLPTLLDRLRARGLSPCVVGLKRSGGIREGFFLSLGPRPWDELSSLPCYPDRRGRWAGVVRARRHLDVAPVAASQLREWGECCFLTEEYVFFGDPAFLGVLREALAE